MGRGGLDPARQIIAARSAQHGGDDAKGPAASKIAWLQSTSTDVRFWHKADIARLSSNVRFWAAAYISVAAGTFDKMVADGRMPRAKRLSEGRVAWDVRALDAAIDSLPSDGMSVEADNSWGDVDAV